MAQAALCDITPQTRIPTLLIFFCVHVLLLVGRCEFRPNMMETARLPQGGAKSCAWAVAGVEIACEQHPRWFGGRFERCNVSQVM